MFCGMKPRNWSSVSTVKNALAKLPWLEIVVLSIIGCVLAVNLLVLPAIGMADNGDFGRMMAKIGLEHYSNNDSDRYFNYFNRVYKIVSPTTASFGDFISTEAVFHQVAFWLGSFFAQNGLWDIRYLGGVHLLGVLLGAVSILAVTRKLKKAQRLLLAGFLILILTDLRLVAYLNSFYSEPAFLIFLLFWLAAAIYWIRTPGRNWYAFIGYFLFSGLLLTTKTQNTLMGIIFAAGGIVIGVLKKDRYQFLLTGLFSIGLILLTLAYYQVTPDRYKRSNLFNIVFHDILATANTEEALAFFQLPEQFSAFKGRDYYMEGGLVHDPEFFRIFFDQTNFADVIRFYIAHPNWVFQQLDRGASQTFIMRIRFLGNFEAASGIAPRSQVQRYTFWSDFKENFIPKNSLFLIFLYLFSISGAVFLWIRLPAARPYVALFLILVCLSGLQFVMTMLVGGTRDTAKQLLQFNILWDATLAFGVVGLAGLSSRCCLNKLRES